MSLNSYTSINQITTEDKLLSEQKADIDLKFDFLTHCLKTINNILSTIE